MTATERQASRAFGQQVMQGMTMESDHFAANLTYYRVIAGLKVSELARRSGIHQSMISRYETGEVFPRRPHLTSLCGALGVTLAQLVGTPPPEVFPPGTPPQVRPRPTPAQPPAPARRLFPRDGRILRLVRAGANPSGGESWLADEASTERYTIQVIGDCLSPEVQEGDLLVLDLDRVPRIGDIVAVVVHGELHVKKVMDRTGAGLYLTSKRGDLTLPDEGAELLGVSIDHTRRLPPPTVSLGNPGPTNLTRARVAPVATGTEDD